MTRPSGATDRVLATVLFTDIVDATELASQLGDRAWKRLITRHHSIVRHELTRFGGREVDTAGDGFFATFHQPAQAIECAAAILERVRRLGMRVRAGIHMGECEVMGDKVGGLTVHVAARVLSHTAPDEIVVTATVREVTAGSGIRFIELGAHTLKGVPGEWQLYAVDTEAQLDFRLLGPLEVVRAGRAAQLGSAKQRAITALLALEANHIVATDRLIDELWGDAAPPSARAVLQVHISNVRKALSGPRSSSPLFTQPPGYVLRLDPDRIDVSRFERIRHEASEERAAGQNGRAADLLREALALWRGTALADVDEPFADRARVRLEEARLQAIEAWIDIELDLRRHADVLDELRAAIQAHPYRERLRAQMMLALYRSGRQADALGEYHDARRVLSEDLGIEPGVELQRLEGAILRQEPSLAPLESTRLEAAPRSPASPAAAVSLPKRTAVSPRRLALVGGAIGLATALAIAYAVGQDSPESLSSVAANSIGAVDAASGRIVSQIPVGNAPLHVISAERSIWVTNEGDRTLSRVDPNAQIILRTYGLEEVPTGLAAGDGRLWVANGFTGTLSRLLIKEDVLTGGIAPKPGVSGRLALATEPGALWVGLRDQTVLRIDALTVEPTAAVADTGHPEAMAAGTNAVWLVADDIPILTRLDAVAAKVSSRTQLRGTLTSVAVGDDSVWVTATSDNRVWRIEPSTAEVVATIGLSDPPTAVAVEGNSVWVASGPAGTLFRLDPASNLVAETIKVGDEVKGITIADGLVWVAVR